MFLIAPPHSQGSITYHHGSQKGLPVFVNLPPSYVVQRMEQLLCDSQSHRGADGRRVCQVVDENFDQLNARS